MNIDKDKLVTQYKIHIAVILVVVVLVAVLVVFTDIIKTHVAAGIFQLIWLMAALLILLALWTITSKIIKITEILQDASEKFGNIMEILEKNQSSLAQISLNTRLSETAKSIASRDADRQSLREAVLDKLHQQDYTGTYEIIDEISHSTVYEELAAQLRKEANSYQDSSDQERVNQVIAHIDKLLDSYQWPRASVLIEKLIKDNPISEKAKSMRQKLLDKKQEKKKELLNAWDEAVKRQDTDRSLVLLKELDLYLTPNEGLALQEAARDAYRNKLHTLGVRFSLAISEKQWETALQTGREIIAEFPNSRMAEEIREKLDILKQKVEHQVA